MTKVLRITKQPFGPLYKGFIARLRALGCVFCPTCYAYVTPEHNHIQTMKEAA